MSSVEASNYGSILPTIIRKKISEEGACYHSRAFSMKKHDRKQKKNS